MPRAELVPRDSATNAPCALLVSLARLIPRVSPRANQRREAALPPDNADRRESIWSVTEGWQRLYLTLFLILHFAGSAVVVRHEVYGRGAGVGVIQSLAVVGKEKR